MFGLSFEKIVIVGIIAAIVLGPSRLPHYAQKLGELARLLRVQIDVARDSASESLGVEDWQSLDPRQYDPRRIIREALHEPARDSKQETGSTGAEVPGRYIVTGSSGHPRRQFLAHPTDSRLGEEESASVSSDGDQSLKSKSS